MKKQDVQISIIVPIYKVEKYLVRCVESLIAQDFLSLEIILIDDGSPDRCGEICDNYAKKDARIIAYHKPNGVPKYRCCLPLIQQSWRVTL